MRLTLINMGPIVLHACAPEDEELTTLPPNVHIIVDNPEVDLFTIGEEGAETIVTVSVTNDGDGEVLVVIGESGDSAALQPGKTLFAESRGSIEIRE